MKLLLDEIREQLIKMYMEITHIKGDVSFSFREAATAYCHVIGP